MDKKALRREIKSRISQMSSSEKTLSSQNLMEMIISTQEWKRANTVLLFSSLPDEIDTLPLMDAAFSSGKIVVLPLVEGDDLRLLEYIPGKISVGSFGIMEPRLSDSREVKEDEISLAIIPGRAFTEDGKRIGRGKGYYDRLLPRISCPKWGVGYSCQKVDSIETDPWDIPMDKVFFA